MKTTILLLAALLAWPPGATAQERGPHQGQRPFERIEQWKKVRLIEILDLKEDQSVRFFARLNEHDAQRREMLREKGEALDRLERLVRNRATAAEIEKEIPAIHAVENRLQEEQRKFFNSLSGLLSTEQQAKYLLFERQFEKELREAMREVQRRRWRQD